MGPNNTLTLVTDPTGKLSQDEINQKNIANLVDAVNALQQTTSNILKLASAEVANDGSTNRVVFGYANGLQQWGLFVSKAGFDALNDANVGDFIFNSNQDIFKIVKIDTMTLSAVTLSQTGTGQWNSAAGSTQKAHGLTFVPIVIGLIQLASTFYVMLPHTDIGVGSFNNPSWNHYELQADATNVYGSVQMVMFSGTLAGSFNFFSSTYTIKYYLLQETAN